MLNNCFRTLVPRKVKSILHRLKCKINCTHDLFLKEVIGIIHVGANIGNERIVYDAHNLNVVWIEPIPNIFIQLKELVLPFKKQIPYCELIAENDKEAFTLHVSSNNGESSSILAPSKHLKLFPQVNFCETISIDSISLPSFIKNNKIDIKKYNSLAIDTQGSELMILRGAVNMLSDFKYIKVEAADFEAYEGGCLLTEISQFLKIHGFSLINQTIIHHDDSIGTYYDCIFKRKSNID